MLTIKTRTQGNSIVVTLSASDNVVLESQKEYFVTYLDDGNIMLTPKIEAPFQLPKMVLTMKKRF